jgi:hypothetical protein
MITRPITIQFLTSCVLVIFICGCHSKDKILKNYYHDNSKLHQELSDSLMSFSKIYRTDVILRKSNLPQHSISFEIHFHDSAELIPVYFDTAFVRQDYKPSRTGTFIIPKTLIEQFKNSIYIGIGSDSTYTFFAYQRDEPKNLIGTSGDSQYGILVLKDTVDINKRGKKISKNACVSHYSIF